MDRRLAAILFLDAAGFSRTMGENEQAALAALETCRKQLIEPKLRHYRGRTVKLTGDGALLEFASVVDAVSFAADFQCSIGGWNAAQAGWPALQYRIGINLGDVAVAGEDIYGDGVNIAARLEALAEPGGICIPEVVKQQLQGTLDLNYIFLGKKRLKNISAAVPAYSIKIDSKAQALAAAAGTDEAEPQLPDLPGKPSIAVLAFDNLSGDQAQDYFSDAISEAIITGLSLHPDLFVIARQSSFSYKGQSAPVPQIAAELGVRFILQGSVQRAGGRLRVSAYLINAIENTHLWTQRYDRDWADVFALQDDLTQHIVAHLLAYEGPVEAATRNSIKTKAPADLKAYDYLLLGRECFFAVTQEKNAEARDFFEKSVAADPDYSLGHAWLGWSFLVDVSFGWSRDPGGDATRVHRCAQKAVALDPYSADAHWILAAAFALDADRPQRALSEYERTLEMNPNNADLWAQYGWTLPRLGRHADAVAAVEKAMRLNPKYPDWYVQALIFALYNAKRYQEAVRAADRITVRHLQTHLALAGSYAQLDQMEVAGGHVQQVLGIDPEFSLNNWRQAQKFSSAADETHFYRGLAKAGLPD